MFEIQRIPGDLPSLLLRDASTGAEAAVVPERGGMVTRFRDRAEITLTLTAGDATRALFPWDFDLELTYAVSGRTLFVEQAITARGPGSMPLHAGYHPYFAIADADKPRAQISTDATRAFDNTTGHTDSFTGFDLTRSEVDLHLLDHRARETTLSVDGRPVVTLQMDPPFTTLVVWTLAGKDYVCIEPWTAPGDALNTGAGLIHLAPGETHRAAFCVLAR